MSEYDPTYCFFVDADELIDIDAQQSAAAAAATPLLLTYTPISSEEAETTISTLSGYPYKITRRFIEINLFGTFSSTTSFTYNNSLDDDINDNDHSTATTTTTSSSPKPTPNNNNKTKKGGKQSKKGKKGDQSHSTTTTGSNNNTNNNNNESEEDFKEKFRTHKVAADTVDHYEVLGIAHLRWTATPAQIRTAYRQMSLRYHPDKMENGDDSVFKRIGKAYEVLGDPQRRREYDSQDDSFDDRVPSEAEADRNDFFELFTPVFDRNARFSVDRNVPRLGDLSTPYADVERFYEFWDAFKSWREFPLDDKYDPNDASTREEKRWILRQNEKKMQKKKSEERARIKRLVDLARRKDPRIARHAEEERAARERKKAAKRREAEERAKKAEEERKKAAERAAEEAERAKKAKEERLRSENRNAAAIAAAFRDTRVHWKTDPVTAAENVLSANSPARIAEIVAMIEGKSPAERHAVLTAELDRIAEDRRRVQEALAKEEAEKKERERLEAEAKKARAPWTDDELTLLAKVVRKYPPGTRDRWAKMMDVIKGRTEEEIIEKTQEIKAKSVGHMVSNPYERLKVQATEKEKETEDGEVVKK